MDISGFEMALLLAIATAGWRWWKKTKERLAYEQQERQARELQDRLAHVEQDRRAHEEKERQTREERERKEKERQEQEALRRKEENDRLEKGQKWQQEKQAAAEVQKRQEKETLQGRKKLCNNPHCRKENREGAQFCGYCGKPFTVATLRPVSPTGVTPLTTTISATNGGFLVAFSRYTPSLVRSIIKIDGVYLQERLAWFVPESSVERLHEWGKSRGIDVSALPRGQNTTLGEEFVHNNKHRRLSLDDISKLTWAEFEEYIASLFRDNGYDVQKTPLVGDQGADLIVKRNGKTIAIQIKQSRKSIGNSAVQEVLGGKYFWEATEAWVITNSVFTQGAKNLARRANVRLIKGDMLIKNHI